MVGRENASIVTNPSCLIRPLFALITFLREKPNAFHNKDTKRKETMLVNNDEDDGNEDDDDENDDDDDEDDEDDGEDDSVS